MDPTNPKAPIAGEIQHIRVLIVSVSVKAYTCIAADIPQAVAKAKQGGAQIDSEFTKENMAIAELAFDRTEIGKTPPPDAIANEIARAWDGYIKFMHAQQQHQQQSMQAAAQSVLENEKNGEPPKQ